MCKTAHMKCNAAKPNIHTYTKTDKKIKLIVKIILGFQMV